ncbi:AgrD family cyclic lactone autoinducer peptide [Clostridium drakei]|uniref:Cyclic lactone autoinducer peptide n=1 Tax=Clostridium drakei TaxID=332101 RepID=A0A2U8DPK9_9CLOT|nr:cyclic lactone autoinducer peptide [Clostridium drakei]AWI04518.1 cyclic lactone autoinducer peptide [Clostridium drakei]
MMFFKKNLSKKVLKTLGSVCLFLGTLAIVPTSYASGQQPKCPDELLK